MGPNFFNPVLINSDADLQVTGKFHTHGDVIDTVLVRILIIPNNAPLALTEPMVGLATIARTALTQVNTGCRILEGDFATTIPNSFGLRAGDKARAIGISVAVKKADPDPLVPGGPPRPQDPPAFETFTWCVNVDIT